MAQVSCRSGTSIGCERRDERAIDFTMCQQGHGDAGDVKLIEGEMFITDVVAYTQITGKMGVHVSGRRLNSSLEYQKDRSGGENGRRGEQELLTHWYMTLVAVLIRRSRLAAG